jgi:manganese-transporting P-type ATPase
MYWGLVLVSALAFSCATEFIPEINTQLKLVPFTSEFKTTMTGVMIVDYLGCYAVEKVLKMLFSDFKPRDIAVRRPDQVERDLRRQQEEKEKADREKEIKAGKA